MQWKGRLKLVQSNSMNHLRGTSVRRCWLLPQQGILQEEKNTLLKFAGYILILAIKTLCRWRFFIILTITMLYSCGLAMALAAGYLSVLAWRHSQWLPLHLTLHSKHSPQTTAALIRLWLAVLISDHSHLC